MLIVAEVRGWRPRPPNRGAIEVASSDLTKVGRNAIQGKDRWLVFNHASFIWSAADLLRGTYKQHQYGNIILPFTVLARLDGVLAPTKQTVLAAI